MSPSALSHALRGLEERLGVRLLHRTTRSVALTAAGERYHARVAPALRAIEEAAAELGEEAQRLRGSIRINAMEAGAVALLQGPVPAFLAAHPAVAVEVVTDAGLVDIVAGGFDAGVRLHEAVPLDRVAVPLGPDQAFAAVAAPGRFADRPPPATPADLAHHRCVRFRFASGAIYRWEFAKDGRPVTVDPPGSLTVDNLNVALEAALGGAGIALVPEAQAERHLRDGRLVRVLSEWCPPFPGLCLYYPAGRHLPRAFAEFVGQVRRSAAARSG